MKALRIVFMGTPQFAVPSLEKLIASQHQVVAVITAPDKPAGRGKQLRESDVKKSAMQHGVPVLQPVNLKSEDFIEELRALRADLFVVVAFRMLPEAVWSMPPYGTVNLHGSLLPDYRGAAPINRAVMNGDTRTGLTTFLIEKEIDTGKILENTSLEIGPDENAGSLHDRMMMAGSDLLLHTVNLIASGQTKAIDQEELIRNGAQSRPAHKIFKEDCRIDWQKSAKEIHDHVRGLSPYPAAWTQLDTDPPVSFKIISGLPNERSMEPGKIEVGSDQSLLVGCGSGSYLVKQIQMEGKRMMNSDEFLRGYSFPKDVLFV